MLTCHHRMVTLIWFQRNLSNRLEFVGSESLHFLREHGRRCDRRIDTARFYRNDDMTAILEEILRIVNDNTRLVRLSDICKDHVNSRYKHAVLVW